MDASWVRDMSEADCVVEFAHPFQILRQATDVGSLVCCARPPLQEGRCACQTRQWYREQGGGGTS